MKIALFKDDEILKKGGWYILVFFMILSSTNFLMFFSADNLPGINFGVTHVTFLDILLIFLGLFCIVISIKNKPSNLLLSIFILYAFFFTEIIFQIFSGRGIQLAENILKSFLVYNFIFIGISFIKTPQDIKKLVNLLTIMVVISVVLHFYEYTIDERIYFKELYTQNKIGIVDNYSATWEITLNKEQSEHTSYIWNRTIIWVYFILVLNSFRLFNGIAKTRSLIISIMSVMAFLMSMIRSWFITVGFTFLLIILFTRNIKNIVLAIIETVVAFMAVSYILSVYNLIDTKFISYMLEVRFESILPSIYGYETTDSNFLLRLFKWGEQYNRFLDSPLFGFGMTTEFAKNFDPDTGIINTLLFGGILGTSVFIYLICKYISAGYTLYKKLKDNYWKNITGGLVLILLGITPMYLFNIDFYTSLLFGGQYIWLPCTCFLLLERISYFSDNNLVE